MADEQIQIYGLDDGLNAHETMTTEQILAAIQRAITTGEVSDKFTAFIEMIKEQNKGVGMKIWIGTQAEFNALEKTENDVIYIFSDDPTMNDIDQKFAEVDQKIEELEAMVQLYGERPAIHSIELSGDFNKPDFGSTTNIITILPVGSYKSVSNVTVECTDDIKIMKLSFEKFASENMILGYSAEEGYKVYDEQAPSYDPPRNYATGNYKLTVNDIYGNELQVNFSCKFWYLENS